jgi:hypothetical protein
LGAGLETTCVQSELTIYDLSDSSFSIISFFYSFYNLAD